MDPIACIIIIIIIVVVVVVVVEVIIIIIIIITIILQATERTMSQFGCRLRARRRAGMTDRPEKPGDRPRQQQQQRRRRRRLFRPGLGPTAGEPAFAAVIKRKPAAAGSAALVRAVARR